MLGLAELRSWDAAGYFCHHCHLLVADCWQQMIVLKVVYLLLLLAVAPVPWWVQLCRWLVATASCCLWY